MTIALIIAADEPALFYGSIDAAELDLEAIDVEHGTYPAAYRPNGENYEVTATEGKVVICRREDKPDMPEDLRRLLLTFFAAMNIDPGVDQTLPALLAKCEPYMEASNN